MDEKAVGGEADKGWQHRLVACHIERCIECYTVLEASSSAGEKKPKVQNVLAVPMLFQSQDKKGFEKNYIIACDCEVMRHVWELLHSGWQSTLSQYSEWCEKALLCKHAEYLLLNEAEYFSDSLWDLNSIQICRSLDDVTLPEPACPVSLVGETEWGLLASVSLNRNNFPRTTILCNKLRQFQCLECQRPNCYKCQHCRFFSNWLAKDCNDTSLKQRLGEWTLREESHLLRKLQNFAQPAWKSMVSTAQAGQDPVDPQTMPLVEMMPKGVPFPYADMKTWMSGAYEGNEVGGGGEKPADVVDVDSAIGKQNVSSVDATNCGRAGSTAKLGMEKSKKCLRERRNGSEADIGESLIRPGTCSPDQTLSGMKSVHGDLPPGTDDKTKIAQGQRNFLPNVLEKKCTKCGVVKRGPAYYKDGSDETGLQSWCRACCLRYGHEPHERLSHEMQKDLRYVPYPRMVNTIGQGHLMSAGSSGALRNQSTLEFPSRNEGNQVTVPNQSLDTCVAPYLSFPSMYNNMCHMDAHSLNRASSMPPMHFVRSNALSRSYSTNAGGLGADLSSLQVHGYQPKEVGPFGTKDVPLWPHGVDTKYPSMPTLEPLFYPNSMISKGSCSVSDLVSPDSKKRLHPSKTEFTGFQAHPSQNYMGTTGAVQSHPYFGTNDFIGGSVWPQGMLPWAGNPNNFPLLGVSQHGGMGAAGRPSAGAQVQAFEIERAQHPLNASKQGHLSGGLAASMGINKMSMTPSRSLLHFSAGFQQLGDGLSSTRMNFMPEQMRKVPQISLKSSEDQTNYCTSWTETPDSDSMGTQGSGSRDWSAPAVSLTNANSHDSETEMKGGGSKDEGTPDELFSPISDAIGIGKQCGSEKFTFSEQRGFPAICCNIGSPVQKLNGAPKRKPAVTRRVPPISIGANGTGYTGIQTDPMHVTMQNMQRSGKRQKLLESYGQAAPELDMMAAPFLHYREKHMSCCTACGAQRSSCDILSGGLCSLCSMIQPIMKTCDTCCAIKTHQKSGNVEDSCPDCGPDIFLPDPPQDLLPSKFLSSEIAVDEGSLPDPTRDTTHDDGQFASLACLQPNGEDTFGGAGAIISNYGM